MLYREATAELEAILKVKNLLDESTSEVAVLEAPDMATNDVMEVRVDGNLFYGLDVGSRPVAGSGLGAAGGSSGCLRPLIAAGWL